MLRTTSRGSLALTHFRAMVVPIRSAAMLDNDFHNGDGVIDSPVNVHVAAPMLADDSIN